MILLEKKIECPMCAKKVSLYSSSGTIKICTHKDETGAECSASRTAVGKILA